MKEFILLLLVLSFSLITSAQELPERRFEAGLIGGFNMSQLDGDHLIGFNKIGINAGGRVSAVLGKKLRLNMELLYSQHGSSRSTTDNFSSSFEKIRLNFVKAPIFISYEEWRFHAYAGLSYNRLINYFVEDLSGADVTDLIEFNPDTFHFLIGTTFYFNEKWGLDINWSKGLNDLQGDAGSQPMFGRIIGIRGIYLL